MSRRVMVAIEGGVTNISFLVGSLRGLYLGVGPNSAFVIKLALPEFLMAGNCQHNWFQAEVDESDGPTILSVRIQNGKDVSCTFAPYGLPGYHIEPGSNVVLTYARKVNGSLEMKTEGL